MSVRDGKVEQTPRIDVLVLDDARRDSIDELVAKLNSPQHRLPQHRRPEAPLGRRAWVMPHTLQRIKEQRKRPLAVRAARNAEVPLVRKVLAKAALDVLPPSDAAVVHEHEAAVVKGVAVVLAKGSLGRGAHVREDQARGRLGGDAVEVRAVPCRYGRGEEAGGGPELRVRVEAYAEAIGIVLAASGVLSGSLGGDVHGVAWAAGCIPDGGGSRMTALG